MPQTKYRCSDCGKFISPADIQLNFTDKHTLKPGVEQAYDCGDYEQSFHHVKCLPEPEQYAAELCMLTEPSRPNWDLPSLQFPRPEDGIIYFIHSVTLHTIAVDIDEGKLPYGYCRLFKGEEYLYSPVKVLNHPMYGSHRDFRTKRRGGLTPQRIWEGQGRRYGFIPPMGDVSGFSHLSKPWQRWWGIRHVRCVNKMVGLGQHNAMWRSAGLIPTGHDEWLLYGMWRGWV